MLRLFILSTVSQEKFHKGASSSQPGEGLCDESSRSSFLREILALPPGLPGEQNTIQGITELMIITAKSKQPKVLHLVVSPESIVQQDLCLE